MLLVSQRVWLGIGTAVAQSLRDLILSQVNHRAYNRVGVKMANCLLISNIKMGGFMGLEKQIAVLGWKMKTSLLITLNRKTIKLVLSLLLLVSSLANAADSLPFYNSEEFTPHWIEPNSPELADFHRMPSFNFINQDGDKISEKSVENKIYVAGFFFSTCPGICPMIRSKLIKVQETFIDDPDVRILQHSIRPSTDTVDILKKYADEHGIISGKWHLLTGAQESIYKLAKSFYFASEDLGNIQNTSDFLHTESILLIDQNRQIRGIYNGLNSASVTDLITDINTLKSELAVSIVSR